MVTCFCVAKCLNLHEVARFRVTVSSLKIAEVFFPGANHNLCGVIETRFSEFLNGKLGSFVVRLCVFRSIELRN